MNFLLIYLQVSRNFWDEESNASNAFRSMSEELSLNTIDGESMSRSH